MTCKSVRHTPQACTRTSTSPFSGFGAGTSVNCSGFVSIRAGELSTQAFIQDLDNFPSCSKLKSSAFCLYGEMLYTRMEKSAKLVRRGNVFTGIIENIGTIEALDVLHSGARVKIHAPNVAASLAVSNSIAVNGCCLTVVALGKENFSADLSEETLH